MEPLSNTLAGLSRDDLVGVVRQMQDEHELQIRRLEIESYKAELLLASRLRAVLGGPTTGRDVERKEMHVSHSERSALGKLLFRKDGRPKKPLRLILFGSSGRPRKLTHRVVFRKNGRPRKQFRDWMESPKYQSMPKAYRF